MIKPRCGDCNHWSPPDSSSYSSHGDYGSCGRIPENSGYWLSGDVQKSYRDANPAVTTDRGDDCAALLCREDFGCVLFKGQPAPDR